VPGGSQALDRTERIAVVHEGREGEVPRPTLLAGIVAKAAACGVPGDPARHLRDLALLCSLVDDPFELAAELTATDRRGLALARSLGNDADPAWPLVPGTIGSGGQITYRILTAPPE
jgi:hypothetical protein